MSRRGQKPQTQSSAILESWAELKVESLGRRELELITSALSATFGTAVPSPATIARILADEGIPLRHPEILDYDTEWRERQSIGFAFRELGTIDDAIAAFNDIQTLVRNADGIALRRLRDQVLKSQQELELLATSPVCRSQMREIATEVALWLRIWLQNPAIFDNWLSLRRVTPEFLSKFG